MVRHVRKDYRSDEGLVALMGKLKVDGIKIGMSTLSSTAISADIQVLRSIVLLLAVGLRTFQLWLKTTTRR